MDADPKITRINEISALARAAWFTLLAYLVFVGITLLGVEDADFFVPSRQTQLPLVGVQIPTASFFWTAPVLGAALYTYLHLFLIKLWEAHADARDLKPLGMHNWIVNDFALIHRGDETARNRPLAWLTDWITRLLVWAAGPFILACFWLRSFPAHSEIMSLVSAASLLVALHAGFCSWGSADRAFGIVAKRKDGKPLRHNLGDFWKPHDPIFLGTFLICATLLRTQFPFEAGSFSTLSRADLEGEVLVPLPEAWRTPETARKAFRVAWCRQEALPLAACDHLPEAERPAPPHVALARMKWCEPENVGEGVECDALFADYDRRFEAAWKEERESTITNLPALDLAGVDLRWMNASGASLVGADLRGARMEGADLRSARMEGADLREAQIQGANLMVARMQGVDLTEARMEGANLSMARMEKANFWEARIVDADLSQARMDGADLSCAYLGGTDLSQAWLEEASLWKSQLQGAELYGAQMNRADLWKARLVEADLRWARMEGANLRGADFRLASLAGYNVVAPAQGADFRGAKVLTRSFFDKMVGNKLTLLPVSSRHSTEIPFSIPSCWLEPPDFIDRLISIMFEVRGGYSSPEDLRAEYLCPSGQPPQPTGTPCALDLTREECLDPARNPHHPEALGPFLPASGRF